MALKLFIDIPSLLTNKDVGREHTQSFKNFNWTTVGALKRTWTRGSGSILSRPLPFIDQIHHCERHSEPNSCIALMGKKILDKGFQLPVG